MIVLSRERDQSVMIGDQIEVVIVDIREPKVRLGINAPMNTSVHRKEVFEAIRRANPDMSDVGYADIDIMRIRVERLTATRPSQVPGGDAAIRLAAEADLVAINDIYNHYVFHSTCTYQEQPEPMEARREWLVKHGPRHPATVAVLDGRVVGWGSLSPYHARSAYRNTVENSVYVHPEFHRRGIGSAILADLIQRAREIGHRVIIAGIDAEQAPSVALHEKFGFVKVGHLREVGCKFGRWLDVIYMELLLRSQKPEA